MGQAPGLDVFFHHRGESFRLPLSKRQPRPPLMSRSHAKCSIEGPVNTNYKYYLSRGALQSFGETPFTRPRLGSCFRRGDFETFNSLQPVEAQNPQPLTGAHLNSGA